jgi:hypothetical protein
MNLKQFLFLPLLYISIVAKAQTQVKYYADFKAYSEGNAQTLDNIIIEQRTKSAIKTNGGNDYKIYGEDKEVNKDIKNTYWAIQNGDDLYLNCKVLMGNKWYAFVYYTGARYLCFDAGIPLGGNVKTENDVSTGLAMGFKQSFAGAITRYNYLLDRQTGEILLLDKKKMLQLLENKPELKKKYKAEYYPHDPKVVVVYLSQLEL